MNPLLEIITHALNSLNHYHEHGDITSVTLLTEEEKGVYVRKMDGCKPESWPFRYKTHKDEVTVYAMGSQRTVRIPSQKQLMENIAERLADYCCTTVYKEVHGIPQTPMPYTSQFTLETLIEKLKERV